MAHHCREQHESPGAVPPTPAIKSCEQDCPKRVHRQTVTQADIVKLYAFDAAAAGNHAPMLLPSDYEHESQQVREHGCERQRAQRNLWRGALADHAYREVSDEHPELLLKSSAKTDSAFPWAWLTPRLTRRQRAKTTTEPNSELLESRVRRWPPILCNFCRLSRFLG